MNKNNISLHKLLLLGRLTLYNTAQFGSDLQSKCYCPCMHQRHMFLCVCLLLEISLEGGKIPSPKGSC